MKHKFQKNITKIITGAPPAHWPGGRPALGISSRIRKVSSYSRRGPREGPRNLFWTPAPRLPPDQRAGGTYFPNFSHPTPLFRILIFLSPFLKKLPEPNMDRPIQKLNLKSADMPILSFLSCCQPIDGANAAAASAAGLFPTTTMSLTLCWPSFCEFLSRLDQLAHAAPKSTKPTTLPHI
jgi:hypothetical protein